MLNLRRIALCLLPWFAFLAAPAAHAQWAVIDVNAIVQLTQQVSVLRQQLTTAENELSQAQSTFSAMTGTRGMQNLLSGTARNYLPTSLGDLQAVVMNNVPPTVANYRQRAGRAGRRPWTHRTR